MIKEGKLRLASCPEGGVQIHLSTQLCFFFYDPHKSRLKDSEMNWNGYEGTGNSIFSNHMLCSGVKERS